LIWELLDLKHGLDEKKALSADESFPLMNHSIHFDVLGISISLL